MIAISKVISPSSHLYDCTRDASAKSLGRKSSSELKESVFGSSKSLFSSSLAEASPGMLNASDAGILTNLIG